MFNYIDQYIGKTLLGTVFVTLSTLIGLSALIKFVEQLRKVGEGDYDLFMAGLFVLFSIPRDIEQFFPMATLIGGLIGMGVLASNSELVVMQAAGMSKWQIIKSAMKSAVLMVLAVLLVGEFVTPISETKAKTLRSEAISGGQVFRGDKRIWTKDGSDFVSIGKVFDQEHLGDVVIYKFADDLSLDEIIVAEKASFTEDSWALQNVTLTLFSDEYVSMRSLSLMQWNAALTPDKLSVATVKPEALSIQGLVEYVDYLDNNQQDAVRYELALWRKVVQPISVGVMLLMAFSFIFGPLRSTTMGARIIMGTLTGFGFFIANQLFGPFAMVYNLPPLLGALLPSFLFAAVATYLLRRS
ncbi:MAG: LPS export ABC transporter permease LptG [Glaciecola sp.]